jgi:dTDP-4-dehydrorhamnose reductase
MERLLVTGIDYPLGANLALALADRLDVLGLYSRQAVECSHIATAPFDNGDSGALAETFRTWRPQWVVHCSVLSASSWDSLDAGPPDERESRLALDLADLAAETGSSLTVVSSDVVFAGPRMFHEESSPANSPSPRAAAVRDMERDMERRGALVVRTHAYGWSPIAEHASFAERAYESLAAGIAPASDGRRHATPILATDLAELLLRAHELRLQGLAHLAGAERTSSSRFVSELAAAFGLDVPSRPAEASPAAWHDETSLNSRRARRFLERSTPLLGEGLHRFAQQATSGWRERLRPAGRKLREHEFAA